MPPSDEKKAIMRREKRATIKDVKARRDKNKTTHDDLKAREDRLSNTMFKKFLQLKKTIREDEAWLAKNDIPQLVLQPVALAGGAPAAPGVAAPLPPAPALPHAPAPVPPQQPAVNDAADDDHSDS
jgi:hypothetical protein